MSISDTDSQMETFHSPLRSESPFRSDDPIPEPNSIPPPSKAIVSVDKYYSPQRSPAKVPPPRPPPQRQFDPPSTLRVYRSGSSVERSTTKVGRDRDVEDGAAVTGGVRRSGLQPDSAPPPYRSLDGAALGFRVCEAVFCAISFSVMAADKTKGWSGDSWDRYKEYRYCLAVNVIGFVYSGFQGLILSYRLATKSFTSPALGYHFDFVMDQVLAYLLMSSSSSAATRVQDWVSNWGNDEFTKMASASIAMSFLAFAAFALSSLVSGYSLCRRKNI
ncbi:unnamed protein product [Cuscuta campestris]|uniref:CASP-like protein n=1 Tax=Cuscuta campestris TaxID=132261 RepID=A0A484N3F2_9ASTE|nr:unnamed protein product [Cuscuta campestris]